MSTAVEKTQSHPDSECLVESCLLGCPGLIEQGGKCGAQEQNHVALPAGTQCPGQPYTEQFSPECQLSMGRSLGMW